MRWWKENSIYSEFNYYLSPVFFFFFFLLLLLLLWYNIPHLYYFTIFMKGWDCVSGTNVLMVPLYVCRVKDKNNEH
jgi:hypothetical protein